jgi:nucleoside-diphosphate-sugar epimerase
VVKNILITGASGFIGSHLVEEGLKRGYTVFAGIRRTSSREYLTDPRIRFLELDFSSPQRISETLSEVRSQGIRFDTVIHNAGITRALRREEYHRVNYLFTTYFIRALRESDQVPRKFVFMSSLGAFGPGDPVTMEPVSETTIPAPVEAYGESKLEASRFLQSLHGFPYLILCPTGVYGPREKDYYRYFRMVKAGFTLSVGTHGQRISFIHVKDLARLVFLALESPLQEQTWVVSDGKNYSSREFSDLVRKAMRRKTISLRVPVPIFRFLVFILQGVSYLTGEAPLLNREKAAIMGCPNWQCDPSACFRDLGFSPEIDLKRGVEDTLHWYRENGWLKMR